MTTETSLHDVFTSKQQRTERQHDLVQRHQLPILTLTLHMPIALAKKAYTKVIFQSAIDAIQHKIKQLNWEVETRQIVHLNIGSEALFVVDTPSANLLKKAMMQIEHEHKLGQLFNIDIINRHGKTVSRKSSNMAARQCMICQQAAHICASTNRHTIEEIENKIMKLCDAEAVCA